MNLEEFKALRRWTNDLGGELGLDDLIDQTGYIYVNEFFIQNNEPTDFLLQIDDEIFINENLDILETTLFNECI